MKMVDDTEFVLITKAELVAIKQKSNRRKRALRDANRTIRERDSWWREAARLRDDFRKTRDKYFRENHDLRAGFICPTCMLKKDDPDALVCSNPFHLPWELKDGVRKK